MGPKVLRVEVKRLQVWILRAEEDGSVLRVEEDQGLTGVGPKGDRVLDPD